VNEDERASQLSAMFDGELPAAECELLSRRLARDEQLRATWSRYAVIGAVLRAEPLAQVRPDFARRVSAALAVPAVAARAGRGGALRSAALGTAIAAGVAGVAILLLRNDMPVSGQPLVAAATVPAAVPVAPAMTASLASIPARLGRLNWRHAAGAGATNPGREDFSYVIPPTGSDNNLAVPASLADYVVAHSEVSSSLARGNLLSVLVSNEAVRPAPDTMLTDGRQ
jgi:sigma-E factor negative regulatory protein RseA